MEIDVIDFKKIPSLYGISYMDSINGQVVVYPMPFNLIVKWWKSLYFWVKKPKESWWEKRDREMYDRLIEKFGKEIEQKYIEKHNRLDQLHDILMNTAINSPISKGQYQDLKDLIN